MNVRVNTFAKNRHTSSTEHSHFDGPWSTLAELVQAELEKGTGKRGYREGVLLVRVEPDGFHCPVVELKVGDVLIGEFKARRDGEEPRKSLHVRGAKSPAKFVEIVLYSSVLLAEDEDNESPPEDGNWEVISINAGLMAYEPMGVETLMHNHFESDGGTATKMSAEEFEAELRRSFTYWKNKATVRGST